MTNTIKNKSLITTLTLITFLVSNNVLAEKPGSGDPAYLETHTHSGFLGNYDDFKVINPQTEAQVWIKPPHEDLSFLKSYKAIVFSPIEIWMDPASSYKGIDPNELKVITDYFLESLHRELSSSYSVVEKSGPGVMNIRIAITGATKKKPDYMKVTNLIPMKLVWEVGNATYRKATSQTVDVFEAQAELEILDSQTGERLVAAIDKHQIKDTHKKDENKDNWAPIEEILDYWAKIIRERLGAA